MDYEKLYNQLRKATPHMFDKDNDWNNKQKIIELANAISYADDFKNK